MDIIVVISILAMQVPYSIFSLSTARLPPPPFSPPPPSLPQSVAVSVPDAMPVSHTAYWQPGADDDECGSVLDMNQHKPQYTGSGALATSGVTES